MVTATTTVELDKARSLQIKRARAQLRCLHNNGKQV